MRRLFLIFMMVLLPLQWSWAVAGSVCEHEPNGTHFGHHQHEHQAALDTAAGHADDDGGADALSVNHPDCEACHGLCAGIVSSAVDSGPAWAADQPTPAYDRYLPDPPVGSLLRPPVARVA
ncbi:MAG: hypothetical protein ACT6S0_10780 [Roseateles sp.]|uniref:hypothetical protein n=1 Tax=Roseateles sp. TaxID=1971397 RepID=UPI004035B54D